jgi:hypothetical protein
MEKLLELIKSIELAIRYLLSGAAIVAVYLLGLSDPVQCLGWISDHEAITGFITIAIGFAAYSIYRLAFYVFGDCLAWRRGWSAPAIDRTLSYPEAYAKFLLWRQGGDSRDNKILERHLDRYLNYRWAVVHFSFILAGTLIFALVNAESGSFIRTWRGWEVSLLVLLICLICAIHQCRFLFQLERNLYKGAKIDPTDGSEAASSGISGYGDVADVAARRK